MNQSKADRKIVVIARKRLIDAMSAVIPRVHRLLDQTMTIQYTAIRNGVKNNVKRHYLANSTDEPGRKVSYAQTSKHKYDTTKRTKTTLSRYLTRNKLTDGMTEHEVELYCQKIGAILHNGAGFQVISGQPIVDFYRDKDIPGSCMCGEYSKYTQVYADNPTKVSMLTFDYNGMTARALLWNAESNGETKIMDRIYPNTGWHVDLFNKWAKQNGYKIRSNNSLPDGRVLFMSSDAKVHDTHTVELSHNGVVPYFDSFHTGKFDDNTLYLTTGYGECDFNSTDGSLPESGIECGDCGCLVQEDDTFSTDDGLICESCYSDNYSSCQRCGYTTYNDDVREIQTGVRYNDTEYWCLYCADNHSTHCNECCNQFCDNSAPTTATEDTGDHYCSKCAESLAHCNDCGESFANSDNLHTHDDELVCSDCHPVEQPTA